MSSGFFSQNGRLPDPKELKTNCVVVKFFAQVCRAMFRVGFFAIGSTLIDAHTLSGQTEGLRVGGGMGGWVGGFMADSWRKWTQGGRLKLALL